MNNVGVLLTIQGTSDGHIVPVYTGDIVSKQLMAELEQGGYGVTTDDWC